VGTGSCSSPPGRLRHHPCRWDLCGEAAEATAVATGAVAAATEGQDAAAAVVAADEAAAVDRGAGMMAGPATE
jgi:hypothetical protein